MLPLTSPTFPNHLILNRPVRTSVADLLHFNPQNRSMKLTLGPSEMQNVAILLEHVDLLDTSDGLDVHLLQSGLQLPVIARSGSSGLLDLLSSGSSLTTCDFIQERYRIDFTLPRDGDRQTEK
jgi:hypothetical protein